MLHVSFNGIASFSRVQTGPHLVFCDRVILCGRERGGRIVWRENRGTRGVYLFATGLIIRGGLKLIGNVSQNILPTVGLLHILFVFKKRQR